MAKEQGIVVEGTIEKAKPNATFDVILDNGHVVEGHVCGKIRQNLIRIIPGDRVIIELSPYDLKRGIIKQRK